MTPPNSYQMLKLTMLTQKYALSMSALIIVIMIGESPEKRVAFSDVKTMLNDAFGTNYRTVRDIFRPSRHNPNPYPFISLMDGGQTEEGDYRYASLILSQHGERVYEEYRRIF